MPLKRSFLKKAFFFGLALQLAGFSCPLFIPKAHALYWEDDGDEGNNPNEVKRRPDHFGLFDWVDDLDKDSKKKSYEDMDNHDKGPGVNNGARAEVLIASGIVGLGAGLFLSYEFSGPNDNVTSNMFIGGALGLGAGVAIGALIMPRDYEVDQRAQSDFLKQRQAWFQDPIKLQIAQAFHPSPVAVSFNF
jgi:hypothetical protein